MFRHNSKIDSAPSHRSLARATWIAWGGTAFTAATLPAIPAAPWVHAAVLPAWLAAAVALTLRNRRARRAFSRLGAARGFAFAADAIPPAPGDDATHWSPDWVPYDRVAVDEIWQGSPVTTWRKRLRADPAWTRVLEAQQAWLRARAPARWEAASAWWRAVHLDALLTRRHGRRAWTRAEIDAAALACAVELRLAIAIAVEPALWRRRLGTGAEAAAWSRLGATLAALPAGGLAPGARDSDRPRHRLPRRAKLFIGRGFAWDARHSQAIEDLKLRDLSEVTTDPTEQGDPRIYGVGDREAGDLFLEEAHFSQMAGIFGATGVGKTRYAEVLISQAVRSGMPVVIIDPKGDEALIDRVAQECRRNGRGHQFRYFCLATPRDRRAYDHLAAYNPCSTYTDPAELASRIASVLPATKDPFWTNVAKSMAETCLTLCHWANRYLRLLARGAGDLPPRDHADVPDLLLALAWARHHPKGTPDDAARAVAALRARMADPSWTPTGDDERAMVELFATRSLADAAIYAPVEWVPTVRHVAEYAIDNTVAFLGWMLKLFHFHLYLDAPKSARADFPRLAAPAEILEKGAIAGALPSAWTIYQRARLHPLELRAEAAAAAPPELARWRAFYARFVPPRPGDDDEIRRMFAAVRRNLESLYSDATKERQKFLEHATTLAGAIKPFLGERARVVCAVAPDLDWSRVADEGQVVYCALGAMIDPHGATSLAKMMVQDIAAWVGQRYQYGGGNLGGSGGAAPREKSRRAARADDGPPVPARAACQPFWLVADEISSFINEPFIDLLNKSRGAGLRVTIIGQTTPDLERQLGSEGARMVKGNLNTFIQLRSQLGEDAEDFSRRAGEVNVVQESRSVSMSPALGLAGHTDVNTYQANESRSYQSREVKRVPPMAVLNLPRGQAFIHAKGQVFLVSQGLMQPCATRFLSEIGMRDDAGEIQAEVAAVRRVPAPVVAPASAAVDDPPASPPTTAPATPSLRDAVFDEA